MKKIIFTLFAAATFFAANAQTAKTMYVMRDNAIVGQYVVSEIDSIIFYAPSIDPLTYDEGVVINGVKWATRNVDKPGTFAATPEAAGMFYQWNRKIGWSATDPMINSNGDTTWDSSVPIGDSWENFNDPSPVGWRVPTFDEIQKLCDSYNVISQMVTQNGVIGIRFTDNDTGKSLFLPVVGYRNFIYGSLNGIGTDNIGSLYWSSTASHASGAYDIGISNSAYYSASYRVFGYSIRPVAEE